VADWGGGISVVLHRRSNCLLSRAVDGRIMRRGIISSCQSAATSEIVKRCSAAVLVSVSSAIASTQYLTFTFNNAKNNKNNVGEDPSPGLIECVMNLFIRLTVAYGRDGV